ncbi:hypothetical protein BU15DRAFT_62402 [Melanogaster broomeanus]|nr:hypothetical protein BU15DRAFT_62402 [Melanogaster broomeanus]
MPYEVEFENGTGFRVDDLAFDGSNWTTYREELIYVAKLEGVVGQFDGTDAPPVAGTEAYQEWSFRNSVATMLVTFTIPDSLLINFYDTKIAQEIFTQLENRFSKSTTPSPTLSTPTQESRQKRDTSNRERRRKVERDRERSGEDQPTDRSVEKRNRKGKRAAERTGEGEAAARRPGEEALDVATASVSLTVKLSSQKIDDDGDVEVHCTSVVPQNLNATRQAASDAAADPATSNNELRDKPHEGAAAATGPGEEAMDQMASGVSLVKPTSSHMSNGSGDVEVHRMSVMSQQPLANNRSTGEAAADATNPDVTSAGPTEPAGAPCRPAEGEPPSMPLEGGRDASGQVTSGHAEHLEQGAHKASRGEEDHARAKPPSTPEEPPSVPLEGEWAAQRHTSGACTGQQHGATAHGEGPHAWAERHVSCAPQSERVKMISMCISYAATYLSHAHHLRNTRSDPSSPPTRHADADDSKRDPRRSVEYACVRKRAPGHIGTILGQSGPPDPSGIDHRCWGSIVGQPEPKPRE